MEVSGDQVYEMYQAGKLQEINDYCLCDTLDTYFVFLRTRVLTGDITRSRRPRLVEKAKKTLAGQTSGIAGPEAVPRLLHGLETVALVDRHI